MPDTGRDMESSIEDSRLTWSRTQKDSMPVLGVLIVLYNNKEDLDFLAQDLTAVQGAVGAVEVHVWDNRSTDGSGARAAELLGPNAITFSDENIGFGPAMNRLAQSCAAPYLLLLNPDCRMTAEAATACLQRLQSDASIGAVSPNIKNGSTDVLSGGRLLTISNGIKYALFVSRLLGSRFSSANGVFAHSPAGADEISLDWLGGTALFLRRQVFEAVGGFNERWFMYGEDVELGMKISDLGYRQIMLTGETVEHRGGGSFSKHQGIRTEWIGGIIDVYRLRARSRVRTAIFSFVLGLGYTLRAVLAGSTDESRRRFYLATASRCYREARVR